MSMNNKNNLSVSISPFMNEDIDDLVMILQSNSQYDYPSVEGPEAMRRVAACESAVFLVAKHEGKPVGCIKAIYDGSRSIIHLLSIHEQYQKKGIGSTLVMEVIRQLKQRGSTTISVTASVSSRGFWKKFSFITLPIFLMLKTDI